MRRAVFFDVDGTILDSMNGKREMTAAVEGAIRKLQAAGDYVFVATGRPYAFISDYLHNFGFDGFLLSNGAQVILDGKTVYQEPMDKKFISEITVLLDELNVPYILEGDHYCYLKDEQDDLRKFFHQVAIGSELMKRDYDIENIDVYKIEIICGTPEICKKCSEILAAYPEYESFFSISATLFEVHAKKNTKGTGILKVLDILDVDLKDSFAFGDGSNDIEMLKTAGCGIAMGNASEEVQSYADQVTDTVGQDGVAKGIQQFILKNDDLEEEKQIG